VRAVNFVYATDSETPEAPGQAQSRGEQFALLK
jgi:hypothetical protein